MSYLDDYEPFGRKDVQETEPETGSAQTASVFRSADDEQQKNTYDPAQSGSWRSGAAQPHETAQGVYEADYQQQPPPPVQPQQAYQPYRPYQTYQSAYTPYNAQTYSNTYPPTQPTGTYRPAQNPYQYSPNSGWQQPVAPKPAEQQYQWNFQDYEKISEAKSKKKKSRGMAVFVIALISVLSISLISISAFGVYSYVSEEPESFVSDGFTDYDAEEAVTVESQDHSQLEIANKPQINESLPIGGKMTIPQVAKAVSPSVVGVIQYQPDMYLQETGMGSGIIMSEDGYIITNAHVLSGGTAFKIVLADGTPKEAELIGSDARTDLAVLKAIDVSGLTPAVFGDSNEIEVGETVIAIGNPAGMELAGSVTQGIVSAIDRSIPTATYNMKYIQTDAAINPGNSGGALVNEYGQVIGINSSKIVAQGYEGIGFAIPISEAKPIVDDIITNGHVTGRVMLGIQGRVIDEIDARSAGLQMGIRIEEISPDSDIANKGVMKFDIITHVDGERIYDLNDLRMILDKHKPGDKVTLTIYRPLGSGTARSNTFDVTIVLMEDKG